VRRKQLWCDFPLKLAAHSEVVVLSFDLCTPASRKVI
jgi:hypothetical protein